MVYFSKNVKYIIFAQILTVTCNINNIFLKIHCILLVYLITFIYHVELYDCAILDELNVLKNISSFTSFSPINDEQSADSGESSCTEDEDARRVLSEEENFFQSNLTI